MVHTGVDGARVVPRGAHLRVRVRVKVKVKVKVGARGESELA